ncbi:MAG: restriction endonuclease subunit S [Candidatus Methylomirabilis sp.]|nr:restriction endonuclease subunit S [Deltaproteobacteria bacterium]
MSKPWPMVPLGEVVCKSDEWTDLKADETYKEVTVKLWGKGVVQRREVVGAEIAATRRMLVRTNQVILSRIDARNGAAGIIPGELDGAVVSNDFPVFNLNKDRVEPKYFGWLVKTHDFVELCKAASEGTTNRVRLQEERFLSAPIPLPPRSEQKRIVERLEELAAKVEEAHALKRAIEDKSKQILLAAFYKLIEGIELFPMSDIAPITRRPIEVKTDGIYPELGIRSFGKGTFHKPALNGFEVGTKRLYGIEPDDLVFSNVFAWEGAVAVAKQADAGRVGSHRFIACVPQKGAATSKFLCFYFLTKEGLSKLGDVSPGGAGRNRTLGLESLGKIKVPVPPLKKQVWFDSLQAKVDSLKHLQAETSVELDAMLPSVLDKAFKGELL